MTDETARERVATDRPDIRDLLTMWAKADEDRGAKATMPRDPDWLDARVRLILAALSSEEGGRVKGKAWPVAAGWEFASDIDDCEGCTDATLILHETPPESEGDDERPIRVLASGVWEPLCYCREPDRDDRARGKGSPGCAKCGGLLTMFPTPPESPERGEGEAVAWMVEHPDGIELFEDEKHVDPGFRNRAIPLYRHPPRPTYTDEDGHEHCPIGGCRLVVESSDEGTSFYRPVLHICPKHGTPMEVKAVSCPDCTDEMVDIPLDPPTTEGET